MSDPNGDIDKIELIPVSTNNKAQPLLSDSIPLNNTYKNTITVVDDVNEADDIRITFGRQARPDT